MNPFQCVASRLLPFLRPLPIADFLCSVHTPTPVQGNAGRAVRREGSAAAAATDEPARQEGGRRGAPSPSEPPRRRTGPALGTRQQASAGSWFLPMLLPGATWIALLLPHGIWAPSQLTPCEPAATWQPKLEPSASHGTRLACTCAQLTRPVPGLPRSQGGPLPCVRPPPNPPICGRGVLAGEGVAHCSEGRHASLGSMAVKDSAAIAQGRGCSRSCSTPSLDPQIEGPPTRIPHNHPPRIPPSTSRPPHLPPPPLRTRSSVCAGRWTGRSSRRRRCRRSWCACSRTPRPTTPPGASPRGAGARTRSGAPSWWSSSRRRRTRRAGPSTPSRS
jgi:hypothetical protein